MQEHIFSQEPKEVERDARDQIQDWADKSHKTVQRKQLHHAREQKARRESAWASSRQQNLAISSWINGTDLAAYPFLIGDDFALASIEIEKSFYIISQISLSGTGN
jgi:glutathione S-transferase